MKIKKGCDVSDYIVRELKMWRTCGSGIKDREKEERSIVQYHYLVWKDFMAPEHPAGILKFIRRMNEAYSLEKGPILIHCRCVHKVVIIKHRYHSIYLCKTGKEIAGFGFCSFVTT
jgi:hypothetical protein